MKQTPSKTFRLFISSTFSDFQEERKTLQTEVFPFIKTYAAKQGYNFQPIDLRWGVSDEAQLDQKTLELCLNEVRACKTHIHPNFLIMLGDRYGWVPLPYAIEKEEFETLYKITEDKQLLDEWYKLDLNQLPPSYILHKREGKYEDYDTWTKIEDRLRKTLQKASQLADISEERKRKYFLSATEAEVEEGIIPYNGLTPFQKDKLLKANPDLHEIDPKYIFGFLREVDPNTKQSDIFIPDEEEYEKAKAFKERIKENILAKNTLEITTKQIDEKHLEDSYLQEFKEKITTFLKQQIDAQKAKEVKQSYTPLQIEQQAQDFYVFNKRKGFFQTKSLKQLLLDINSYIDKKEPSEPFILYGASGRGKSALMAKAIEEANDRLQERVLYRFVGATPHSNSSQEILISIFDELGIDLRSQQQKQKEEKETVAFDTIKEIESFEEFSDRVYQTILNLNKDIVIFIDAIDQLQNNDEFLWLPKQLPSNVKIILSCLNDENYPEDTRYYNTLKKKFTNLHEIPPFSEPLSLLKEILKEYKRTLTKEQADYFLKQYKQVQTPLYIIMAAQEIKVWKSYDKDQTLESSQKGIIEEFIANLHDLHKHDKRFVQRVLGYIYASRDGLSESEILELLATDKEFIDAVAPQTYHENPTRELPLVHWSRLYAELKPFLSIKEQDNEELLYFFHREFEDAIANQEDQKEQHVSIIKATQTKILQTQDQAFDDNRWGKLYITLITEYVLRYGKESQEEFAKFLSDTQNLKEEWIAKTLMVMHTIGYEHHKYNRMQKAIAYQEITKYTSEKLYEKDPARWAELYTISLNNLAASYKNQNRLDEAIELGKEFLEITKELYEKDPARWAEAYTISLNNLAVSYKNQNHLDEAIELGKKALEIREELYEKDPARWAEDYTASLSNLAISYYNQNHLDEAIELEKKSLEITKVFYEIDPARWAEYYTISLNNLATSYKNQNHLDEAIELEKKSLEITEKLYEKDPARWAELYTISLSNLAVSYYNQNHLDEAIELGKKALEIREELYEKDPARWAEDYTTSLNNLATSYANQNRLDEAIRLLERKYEVSKKYYGEKHDRTLQALKELEYIKSLNQNNHPQNNKAKFTDLLYLAKFLAYHNKEDEIGIESLVTAFGFIEFYDKAKSILSQYDPDDIPKQTDAQKCIEFAKELPEILYSSELKKLISQLEEIFGDEYIGTLR